MRYAIILQALGSFRTTFPNFLDGLRIAGWEPVGLTPRRNEAAAIQSSRALERHKSILAQEAQNHAHAMRVFPLFFLQASS